MLSDGETLDPETPLNNGMPQNLGVMSGKLADLGPVVPLEEPFRPGNSEDVTLMDVEAPVWGRSLPHDSVRLMHRSRLGSLGDVHPRARDCGGTRQTEPVQS